MKRLAALLAAVALTLMAAPANADEPDPQPCAFTVPELPGECLSQGAYDLIQQQRGALNQMHSSYERTLDSLLASSHQVIQLQLENVTLRQRVVAADAAAAKVPWLEHRVIVLRAKVKELRLIIHG